MASLARELAVRTAVAAVALPIVGAALWLGHGLAAALFALTGAIATHEYYRMTPLRAATERWIGIAATAALCGLPLIVDEGWASIALGIAASSSMVTWVYLLASGPRLEAPARVGHVLAGVTFVAGGLVALAWLRARPAGLAWSAIVLAAAWGNDTGAFVGGKLLGKHRMLPAVSPGKTWEGFAVGAAVGLATATATRLWFDSITRDDAIAVGLIAAVLGPVGDLSKSLVKRAAGVKDSGRLLLAHGGMLDRIDAVLFDAVGVLAYVALIRR